MLRDVRLMLGYGSKAEFAEVWRPGSGSKAEFAKVCDQLLKSLHEVSKSLERQRIE